MNMKAGDLQQVNFLSKKGLLWPFALLAFGFIFITLHQSDYFRAIPGNMGDARFNNVILEHLFLWFTGKEQSLWSPGFFYPYPGTLSFSDNHFGTGGIYILMRLLGLDPEVAFIGWYTVAIPLNYLSCYYTLKRMGLSERGSALGAFVFTFALNVSARHGHAQLAYRFAIPLAMLAWQRFVDQGRLKQLALVAVWLTLQFYCSIYLGYFLLLLLIATFVAQLLISVALRGSPKPFLAIGTSIRSAVAERSVGSILTIVLCVVALLVLFYPYMHYSNLYGFHRGPAEIESMLPRPISYFLADGSMLWGNFSAHVPDFPMRWEHQMFFGAAACALAAIGLIYQPNTKTLVAFLALALLVTLTLSVHGHSLYSLIDQLPLANAIRAVTRIGLVLVFPVAILAGSGFDWLTSSLHRRQVIGSITATLLLALLLVEYSAYLTERLPLQQVRARLAKIEPQVPPGLANDAILYVPSRADEPYYFGELDGIRLSQALHRTTINGYSGNVPSGFNDPATTSCAIVNNRLTGYASFAKLSLAEYQALVNRVVIVGERAPCIPESSLPTHTHYRGELPDAVIKGTALRIEDVKIVDGRLIARFLVENDSPETLPSISDDDHPIRFSWRLVQLDSTPGPDADWAPRRDLTTDVPAGDKRSVETFIDAPRQAGSYRLEASLVQEGVLWFHHSGMPIAKSDQIIEVTDNGTTRVAQ